MKYGIVIVISNSVRSDDTKSNGYLTFLHLIGRVLNIVTCMLDEDFSFTILALAGNCDSI